jgi:hypothetical protein
VLLGGRTRRQFPEQSEQGRGGLLVGDIFQRHGCHEVGRGGVEAHADNSLSRRRDLADGVISTPGIGHVECRNRKQLQAVRGVGYRFVAEPEYLQQLCVLRLGFLQDGDVRISIFPESEEVLIGGAAFL